MLDEAPGRRTVAAILTPERCLVRHRSGAVLSVRVEPCTLDGRVLRVDPAAAVSAVHAWLGSTAEWPGPTTLTCEFGPLTVRVELTEADDADLGYEI